MALETRFVVESGGDRLACRFLSPGHSAKSSPLVIVLTGDSPKGTRSKTWGPVGDRLTAAGFGVLLFDFLSQGDSEGDRERLTLTTATRNYLDVVSHVRKSGGLRRRPFGLLASSMGASVVLNTLTSRPKPRCIVFKSPASFLIEAYETEHPTQDAMEKWAQSGLSSVTGLGYQAYEDAARHNLYRHAARIPCPTLVIHGDSDTIVPVSQSRRLVRLARDMATLKEVQGANHDYSAENATETFLNEMEAHFCRHLLTGDGA